jgi:hypothetical protein
LWPFPAESWFSTAGHEIITDHDDPAALAGRVAHFGLRAFHLFQIEHLAELLRVFLGSKYVRVVLRGAFFVDHNPCPCFEGSLMPQWLDRK